MQKSANRLSINELKFYFLHLHTVLLQLITYVARHTFATTIALRNGVPLSTLQQMLGHKSIETTQHYARMVNVKVGEDMEQLSQVFKRRKAFKDTRI